MKGILKTIQIPVYNTKVTILIHNTSRKAIKQVPKLYAEYRKHEWERYDGAYIHDEKKNSHVIVVESTANVGTVSHECFHATMSIVKGIGVIYEEESEEAFAYMMGYLMEKTWKLQKKFRKKNS